ncbi:cytochrome P450 [Kribbella sp. NPDC004536]|uniref:cytochrome P450 n=1 Tax=Kribbella sp. NPDC004536 TaxID=3364106 RepID=UPI0036C5B2BF
MLDNTAVQVHQPTRPYDPFDGPQLADPYPLLAEARQNAPVFYSPRLETWVVTRYRDIAAILGAPDRFSSTKSIHNVTVDLPQPVIEVLSGGIPYAGGLVDMDPPTHTIARRLFNKAFTPRNVAGMTQLIEAQTRKLLDEAVAPPVDLATLLSHPLPVMIIAGLFKVPDERLQDIKHWSDEWLLLNAQQASVARLVAAASAVVDFQLYIAELIEARRLNPLPADLLTDLLKANAEREEPVGINVLVGVIMTMLLAGHETTSGLITHSIYQLCLHPDAMAEVLADPDLVDSVLTETLRFDPPTTAMYRTANVDVEIAGIRLPAGSHLHLSYSAGNRDPEVYSDPDRFDIHRTDTSSHLGFGHGIHYCIGSALALLEGRIALSAILERFAGLRLAAGYERHSVQSATIRVTPSLVVEWDS